MEESAPLPATRKRRVRKLEQNLAEPEPHTETTFVPAPEPSAWEKNRQAAERNGLVYTATSSMMFPSYERPLIPRQILTRQEERVNRNGNSLDPAIWESMRRNIMQQYADDLERRAVEASRRIAANPPTAYPTLTADATVFGMPIPEQYIGREATPALMEEMYEGVARQMRADAAQQVERREVRDSTGAIVSIAMMPSSNYDNLFSEAEKAVIDSRNKLVLRHENVLAAPEKSSWVKRLRDLLSYKGN